MNESNGTDFDPGALLRGRGLRKEYGSAEGLVRAVDDVDVDVAPGETLAIMGPSGCGKSTLLHLLGGLDRPSSGQVWLGGQRLDTMSERGLARMRRRSVGFVFQAFHLMDELTALENIELPALLAGCSARAARRRAIELLEQVELSDRATHLPSALSGGQRQRVAIARALANEPTIVLADEPTGNLDSGSTLDVLRLFDRLRAGGQTLVIVTHDERIAATADRLVSMRDGTFVDETRFGGRDGESRVARRDRGLSAMGGRIRLISRLAGRDVRRRWTESLLLVLAIAAGAATLTLGLLLHNVTTQPYSETQAATRGADVVAQSSSLQNGTTSPADLAALEALSHAKGVVASSGPYPMTTAVLRTPTVRGGADIEGRSESPAAVDQPLVTSGTWVRPGGVVVERSFAQAGNIEVGQTITLNGRPFRVDGIAVTAAFSPYPQTGCLAGCAFGSLAFDSSDVGLMWTTEDEARSLATTNAPLTYFTNLKLSDPEQAVSLAGAPVQTGVGGAPTTTTPSLVSAEEIAFWDSSIIRNEQTVVLVGASLLTILSIASVAVLVGGRMADQMRRVGLLKAIGGTPGLVASVLMAEYLFLALVGAGVGLLAGWLFAPVLTEPGAGFLGSASRPPLTVSEVLVVGGVALGVAVVAALVPALRAARTSTVRALADSARPPHRSNILVKVSARLPVPLLIGLRVMARRLRRTALSVLSIFVTVSGIVAVLIVHGQLDASGHDSIDGLLNPKFARANEVLFIITVSLVILAAVNAVFITRAIAQDARHTSAVTRALGATPQQVTAGLSLAQTLPALLGALLGFPGGFLLYGAAKHGDQAATLPPLPDVLAVIVGAVVLVALLTALPVRWAGRRPVASILQAELA